MIVLHSEGTRNFFDCKVFLVNPLPLGGVHKLRLQDLAIFDHLAPGLHFPWYKSLQKVKFFDHLPPSSCKGSL